MKRGLRYPGRTIRTKLFGSYVVVCLPLLILILYFAHEWPQKQHALLTAQADGMGARAANQVEAVLERSGTMLSAIARFPGMRSQDPEQLSAILGFLLALNPRFVDISLTDLDGTVVADASGEGVGGAWLGDRSYIQAARAGRPVVFSEGIIVEAGTVKNEPGFVVGVPFIDEEGQQVGVLVARLRAAEVLRDVLSTSTAPGLTILVVDQTNRIVLHPRPDLFGRLLSTPADDSPGPQRGGSPGAQIADPWTGEVALARFWPVGTTGWSVVVVEPLAQGWADEARQAAWVGIIVLVALALSTGCALLLGGRMCARIARLVRAAEMLTEGRLGVQVAISGEGETAVLLRAFNTMSARMAEMVRQLEQTRLNVRRAYRDVARALTGGFDTEQSLHLLLRVVMSRLDVQAALVGRVEEEGRSLQWIAQSGNGVRRLLGFALPLDDPSFLAVQSLQRRRVVSGTDQALASTIIRAGGAFDFTHAATMVAPLRVGSRVTGVIQVFGRGGRFFDAEEMENLRGFAGAAALALDNARLYQRAERERVRLKSIIDSLPEGIIVAEGAAGRTTIANRVSETMWGRPISPGTELADLARALAGGNAGEERDPRSADLFDTMATGRAVFSREITVRRPDGSVLELLASSAPYAAGNDDACGMVAVFQDISRIKEIERLKDEFLSITSHELRTPLTSLKGFAQIVLRKAERTPGREDDAQALHVVNRQINRMTALVSDLLDVSRIQAGQMTLCIEQVDLVALARRVAVQVQAPAIHHRLTVRAREDSLWGSWDERRLEQVMTNLLDNAVKYSQGGLVEVTVCRQRDEAVVSVRDGGVGLSKENQSRVFERFYRGGDVSTRQVGGLGLGLYICNQLVRCHGGRMWVESEEGSGSTFSFALPVRTDLCQHQGGGQDDKCAEGVDCRR